MIGQDALEELKRVDHMVYVTLKYTRTCDVIKNTIKRIIAAFDSIVGEALEYKKVAVPNLDKDKMDMFYKILNKRGVKKYFNLYFLLKKLDTAKYTPREEYRKHVTMVANVDNKVVEVDVPTLHNYYIQTREFVNLIIDWMKEK